MNTIKIKYTQKIAPAFNTLIIRILKYVLEDVVLDKNTLLTVHGWYKFKAKTIKDLVFKDDLTEFEDEVEIIKALQIIYNDIKHVKVR